MEQIMAHLSLSYPQPYKPLSLQYSASPIRMEIASVNCECCGLREDCTQDYISSVKANFEGKWLCGLCSEAVRDEISRGGRRCHGVEESMKAHMSFCRKIKSNPAIRVADGMRQMLRRRSGDMAKPALATAAKKFGRSISTSQVGDESRQCHHFELV